jgi:hypothetical protein
MRKANAGSDLRRKPYELREYDIVCAVDRRVLDSAVDEYFRLSSPMEPHPASSTKHMKDSLVWQLPPPPLTLPVVQESLDHVPSMIPIARADFVGIYFNAHWSGPGRRLTPKLVDAYHSREFKSKRVVFVLACCDDNEEDYEKCFRTMPWYAVPFREKKTVDKLKLMFGVKSVPWLTIMSSNGVLINEADVDVLRMKQKCVREWDKRSKRVAAANPSTL